jgi:hypothetical protein
MRRTGRLVVLLTVAGALALAPAAFAQSAGSGYGGQSGIAGQVAQGGSGNSGNSGNGSGVAGETANGSAASDASGANGFLPFTGLDLAFLAGGGLLLLASGVVLSRTVSGNPRVGDR